MNSTIKNIIFDMGGVLIDLRPERAIAAFEALGASNVALYIRECRMEDLFLHLEMGTISTHDFCDEVRHIAHISCSDEAIVAAWDSLLEPSDDIRRQALLRLKAKGYRLFVLSNTCDIHWQSASHSLIPRSGLSIDDYFEHCFLSYEMHCRKPALDIYVRVLEEAHLVADETLFIDDNETNLLPAASLGIHTFLEHDSHHWVDIIIPRLL